MQFEVIQHGSEKYQQMVALRSLILREPLGLRFSDEDLAKEKYDLLLAGFEGVQMMACCLLTRVDDRVAKLRQMAVQTATQGSGAGKKLMQFAEQTAREHGYREIVLHARKTAIGFYEKMGYRISGEEFVEVTIPHIEMIKAIGV